MYGSGFSIGDTVAIRGDRCFSFGKCTYTPDQLIDGKFLKRPGTEEMWTGTVQEIQDIDVCFLLKVSSGKNGGWREAEKYEKV